jgi:Ca2+-binding RTX toxin-like protein
MWVFKKGKNMIKVSLGETGVSEFNFASFLLDALVDDNFKADIGENKIRLYSGKDDYIELTGHFDTSAAGNNPYDYVEEITGYRAVVNGKESYAISGLHLTADMLGSFTKLSKYLSAVEYQIAGNGEDNSLSSAGADDVLNGLAGNDVLVSNDGDDILDGGKGNDRMSGGNGDDTYYVDSAGDKITETASNSNGDKVYASANFSLENADHVENLSLEGKGNINATGNGLDNVLRGNSGDNRLDGGKGNDDLFGGDGDDLYIIDSKQDDITEAKNDGNDAVGSSSMSIDLRNFSNIEDVFLFGKSNLNATGDSGSNELTGNDGKNELRGGRGNDVLTGEGGSDDFVFVRGDGKDVITDFSASGKEHDVIDLSDFGGKLKFGNLDIDKLGKHDVDIDFGKGDHLILENVNIKDIDASDFHF